MILGILPQQPMKSVIFTCFKKRSFYYLHSGIDECGLNLAALLSKIMGEFSSQVSSVNI